MKKIFISLLAVAALAACSKSEVQYEPAEEIGFAPVASNVTKSVAGYNGDTFDGTFPTDVDLYVFANAQADDLTNSWPDSYFKNALFEYDADKNKGLVQTVGGKEYNVAGAYAGSPTRYWPNVKSLIFAGVSKACNVNAETSGVEPTMSEDFTTINIAGYTQDNANNTAEGTNDLMYFPWDGTSSYSKANVNGKEIPAQMKHACSWITINVYGDDVTATYTKDDNTQHNGWTLNKLEVTDLVHTASVACSAAYATWTIADNATKTGEVYYETTSGTTFTATADEYATSTKDNSVANNFIVIPQTPTYLEVTYTYTSDATNNITLTETKSVSLDYDGVADANAAWQSGVHYIYNVLITASEILIDPVVVDWTDYTRNNIEKEA